MSFLQLDPAAGVPIYRQIVEGIEFAKEEYGIGFRKGSDLTEKVNEALQELADEGVVAQLAEKYPSVMVTLEAAQ